ncbi:YSIRK-type signal peptide-containing protein [Lactobacillus sp. ESL0701]|uniref:pectate lyase-like adhesive domain-containing protein n=1 Tax=Lactobacillus sp. ESL0701 TaxID=2983217 RepID=UPI0023F717C0|nr:pectate lyase-like adhesive domain-containing protein [Lactobacillus sp. ESL0701]MDF7672418.1 YSIRK-type signal peptide-containing protein [Lactobacillus sp. ESL0701]
MVGKNNFDAKNRKVESQSKHERFSIRKLSMGATSVLLGITFMGLGTQTTKADTIVTPTQTDEATNNTQNTDEPADKPAKKANLTSYKGLTSYLNNKSTGKKAAKTATSNQKQAAVKEQAADTKTDESTATTAATKSTASAPDNSKAAKPTKASTDSDANVDIAAPAAKDSTSTTQTAKSDQTTDSAVQATDVINQAKAPVTKEVDPTVGTQAFGSVKQVTTWQEFVAALKDATVSEIDLENDIASDNTGGRADVNFPQRKILIQSDPARNKRFILDLHYSGPRPDDGSTDPANRGTTDLTYHNLSIYTQSYYGLDNTVDGTSSPCKLTLDDIDFTGSQVTYSGQYSDIYIKNTVTADAVQTYVGPLDGKTYTCDGGGQQLFELNQPGQNLVFTKDCKFVGSSSDGNVLELDQGIADNAGPNGRSRTNNILIDSGADVTLNPRKDPGNNGDNAQNTGKASGIFVNNGEGSVTVNKRAKLTINVGTPDYTGGLDMHRTAAIMLTSKTGNNAKLVDNGTININTNGDISDSTGGNTRAKSLIYDQGSLSVGPGASLNIYGKNMQDYSGTLIYITGKADLNNGSLHIELQDDPKHPGDNAYGAGTKPITLLDVSSSAALTVNNPNELVLNASKNTAAGTSIIGDSAINIKNVRQVFDFSSLYPGMKPITLPPFHVLNVQKKTVGGKPTIGVNKISVLNGKQTISAGTLQMLQTDLAKPENSSLVALLQKVFGPYYMSVLQDYSAKQTPYDQIFSDIISAAFSDPTNPGYNNIRMVSPNEGGFLDIEDDNGVPGQASYHQNPNGSITITGKVDNFNYATDGPVQSDNPFSKLMSCGTDVYVKAQFRGQSGIISDPANPVADPYINTNDVLSDLNHVYSTKASPDGTFSITIPAGTSGLFSGAAIDLTPEANFIGYDPEIKDKMATVYLGNIMDLKQMKAATEKDLDAGLDSATARVKGSGLSVADQTPHLDKIQKAHDDAVYYIDNATDFDTINYQYTQALDIYNHEAAKSELEAYANNCITVLNVTDANVRQQIANKVKAGDGYIDSQHGSTRAEAKTDYSAINQARDTYTSQILDICKSWLNNLLKEQCTNAKADIDKHPEITNASDLKDKIDAAFSAASRSITMATDADKLNAVYQDSKSKIASYASTKLNNQLKNEATTNIKNKWVNARTSLMKLTKLTVSHKATYQSQLTSALTAGISAVNAATTDTEITTAYNDFSAKVDAIIAAATAENNQ